MNSHNAILLIEEAIRKQNPDYADYIIKEAYRYLRKRYLSRKYRQMTANQLLLVYYTKIIKQINIQINYEKE